MEVCDCPASYLCGGQAEFEVVWGRDVRPRSRRRWLAVDNTVASYDRCWHAAHKPTIPGANIYPATKMSGISLGGASMETEGVDAQGAERVFAVMNSQTGSRLGIVLGLQHYAHAKEVMTGWAERLVKRLDDARGRDAKRSAL